MKFIIQDEERKINAIEYINRLNYVTPFEIHIKPYKKNRTRSQNDTMHMWIDVICDFRGTDKDTVKKEIKYAMGLYELKDFQGELAVDWKTTAKFTVKEMQDFMSAIEIMAVSYGLKIPYPDDLSYAIYEEKGRKDD